LVYLSSGMLRVRVRMDDLLWTKRSWSGPPAYAESKLCDVLLAFAVARRWNDVRSNALEPGWVATKMGGPSAPDDLRRERRRVGEIDWPVFLSSTPSCAESDRGRPQDSGRIAGRVRPHLWHTSRLTSALRAPAGQGLRAGGGVLEWRCPMPLSLVAELRQPDDRPSQASR
jgi:NAD(P)-dependent dehydrogenase (short-subunit alcohol dehydrogenase family)